MYQNQTRRELAIQELIEFIHDTFSKTAPTGKKLDFYIRELGQVELDAIGYIKNWFREKDSCPSNLAKEIRAANAEWKAQQKLKKTRKQIPCTTCNRTGYLRSLEVIPKPEWGIRCLSPRLMPVTWTCPHCDNWDDGLWERHERCDPPDRETLARCNAFNEDFEEGYREIMEDFFKEMLLGERVTKR